jgi:hypothetical protein
MSKKIDLIIILFSLFSVMDSQARISADLMHYICGGGWGRRWCFLHRVQVC